MRRKIALLRHAKSSWEHTLLDDFNRPLSKRGIKDVKLMSPHIKAALKETDSFFSSSAIRMKETLKYVFPKKYQSISFTESLYNADKGVIIKLLTNLDSEKKFVVIAGHNPGIHAIAELLLNSSISKFSTCALMIISTNAIWDNVKEEKGILELFIKPSNFKSTTKI